jgi:hypothetical protein
MKNSVEDSGLIFPCAGNCSSVENVSPQFKAQTINDFQTWITLNIKLSTPRLERPRNEELRYQVTICIFPH